MGSLFKAQTPAPTPPAPPTTVRDEVNGVEQVPITNADGSVTYITRAIPLTAAQQAEKDKLDGIMNDALAEIQKLSATDYSDDNDTKRVLDQWQQAQQGLLKDAVSTRAQSEELRLAKRGLADSSAAAEVRRLRALDEQKATQNLALTRDELSSQVRGQKLALQQNLYSLAAGQTNAEAAQKAQAATRAQSSGIATNAQRQASLLDYSGADSGFSVFGKAAASAAGGKIGATIGGAVGGPIGSAAGSFLGSWLMR